MAKHTKSGLAALALAVAALGAAQHSFADTPVIYVGPNNGSYNTIGNWSPNGVPTDSSYAVTIGDPTDPNVTVTLQIAIAVDTLTVDAGSTLQLLNGSQITDTTLTTVGTGAITTAGGQFTPQFSGNVTLTTGSQINIVDNSGINFAGGSTYTNDGTISLLSAGNGSRIGLSGAGTVTFAGTGSIIMGAGGNNYITALAANMTLDNQATHTISGNGQFNDSNGGTFAYTITNEGTITALNGTLTVSQGGTFTNTGTLRAGDGTSNGTLLLESETYTNTGGTIVANTGSTVLVYNGANIIDGTLETSGTGTFSVSNGNFGGTISGNATLTAGSNILIDDNSGINLASGGVFTNNGTITLASTGNGSRIGLTGGGIVSLAGSGSIVMNAGGNNYITAVAANMTLDNQANHTISGNGQFNDTNGGTVAYAITNEGTITALNGTLTVSQGGTFTNTGTLRAGDGTSNGTLVLENETYTNTGGTIAANTGSTVLLYNGANVIDGTLETSGTGVFSVNNGNFGGTISGNVTLTAGSNILIQNNSGIEIATGGVFTNNGTISLASTGNASRIGLTGTGVVTFGGNGTINFSTNTNQNYIAALNTGVTLDNTANHTISGIGQFTEDPAGTQPYAITNEGLIAALGGTLVMNQIGNVTNTGTLEAGNGTSNGTLLLENETFTNTGGQIIANAGSTVLLNTSSTVSGGTLRSNGNGTFSTTSGQTTATLTGPLAIASGTQITIVNNSYLTFSANATYTNDGTISLLSSGNAAALGMSGTGTVTFAGSGSIVLATNQSTNNIIVARNVGVTLDNTANHTISGIGQFTEDPAGTQPYAITNEGLIAALGGTLAMNQQGSVTNTGTLEAGNGISNGTLVLENETYTNTGGQIIANAGGTVLLNTSSTVSGGTLRSNGNGTFSTSGGQTTATLTGPLAIASGTQITIVNNSYLTFSANGTYTNDGTISLLSSGNAAALGMSGTGTVTFAGSGSIVLATNQSTNNIIVARNVGVTLDNTANHTISGIGQFTEDPAGTQPYAITNEGLIAALGGTLAMNQQGSVTNTGTLLAGDGTTPATLALVNDTFTNAGGLIEALAGSTVSLQNGSSIIGGTIQSLGNGSISTIGGQFNAQLSGNILFPAGTQVTIPDNSGINFGSGGVYTNNGTISLVSGGNQSRIGLNGNGTVVFDGSGSIVFGTKSDNYIAAFAANMTLDNQAAHTISGSGQFTDTPAGSSAFTITNEGTLLANVSGAQLLVAPGVSTANTGIFEATGGGTLNVTGSFLQDAAGTLSAGTYMVNDVSLLTLANSATITTIGADATVILTGANSAFPQIDTTPSSGSVAGALGTVTSNDGTLEFLGGRNYTVSTLFTNSLWLQLGGGTFTASAFTNNSGATLFGFGTVAVRPISNGLIEANGGTLAFTNGVDPTVDTGTLQSDAGATLDLSAGALGSQTGYLINNGNLVLGNNNVTVSLSYTNANFGVGDSFNKHANVATTGGQILANGDNTEVVSAATLNFQNVHVGDVNSLTYTITNAGTNGPAVLYAIRPTTNGGTLSDLRLSGSGVTSSNVGPLAIGVMSSPLTIVFTASGDGPLVNQTIDIDNNFDNITGQTVTVSGTAYNYAAPSVAGTPLNLGNFHVGDPTATATYTIGNTAPADGYSEQLDATATGPTGAIAIGGSTTVAAGGSNNVSITALLDPIAAGHQIGTATLQLVSDGTGTSGLGNTPLSSVSLSASANVYRYATPSLATPNPINFGNHHVGDTVAPLAFVIGNTDPADGFSEDLDGSLSGVSTSGVSITGNLSLVAPGTSVSTILATLDTSSAGNKSGYANVDFVSDGTGTSNLGNTPLVGQSAYIAASGNVYRLAAPATVANINLGTIHVGDSGAAPITVGNTDPNDGFSENLDASFSTPITGPVSTSANTITVGPGASNSTGLILTLDTSAAAIGRTGAATLHFASNGTGSSGLGITSLNADQTVSITANVLNYAKAAIQKDSGDGTLSTADATDVTLNFGDVTAGDSVSATLGVLNAAAGPSDTLAGAFTLGSGDFTTTGFSAFSGITSGGEQSGLSVSFSNLVPGLHTETITLAPSSQDVSYDGALPDITLTLSVNVVPTTTPEPASLVLLGLGATALLTRRKR